MAKEVGLPLADGLESASADLPHTITAAIMYRLQINSFSELPKDKQPPRNLWDKPGRLEEHFDMVFDRKKNKSSTEYVEYDLEDVE